MTPHLLVALSLLAAPSPASERPAALTTAQESQAQRPSWPYLHGYAPQVSNPRTMFDDASADLIDAPEVEGALLICRVDTFVNQDTFGQNDLLTEFDLGKAPTMEAVGPEDTSYMFMSVPLVSLKKGDPIKLLALDRDVTTNEEVGTLKGKYDGRLPLRLENKAVALSCRALLRDQVEAQVTGNLRGLDERLAKVPTTPKINPALPDYGVADTLGASKAGLMELAARVGWADPRTQKRLQRYAALEQAHQQAVAAYFAKEQQSLPAPGTPVTFKQTLQITVQQTVCGAQAKSFAKLEDFRNHGAVARNGCVTTVKLENTGTKPVVFSRVAMAMRDELPTPRFLSTCKAQGTSIALRLVPGRGSASDPSNFEDFTIEPKQTVVADLMPVWPDACVPNAPEPLLLQFQEGSTSLRVRVK